MSLQNAKVLIVGGSSGIGFATARMAVDQGAQVVIASSSAEKLAQAKALLNGKIETAVLNMLQVPDVQRFFDHSAQTIDHLVISNPTSKEGAFLELDIEQARQLFETKFWGAYHVVKYGVSHIAQRGSITLFSGVNVISSKRPPLAAVNAAVNALVTSLAIELAPLRVNAVSPGIIDTPLRAGLSEETRNGLYAKITQQTPVGKIGVAEEVALGVIYLLNNSYVSGTVLDVDGGLRLI